MVSLLLTIFVRHDYIIPLTGHVLLENLRLKPEALVSIELILHQLFSLY